MKGTMSLDDAVQSAASAIESAGAPTPDALLFAATGSARWIDALDYGVKLDFADVDGTPEAFRSGSLFAGTLTDERGTSTVWIVDDAPRRDSQTGDGSQPLAWARAFPVWLSAACGAKLLIHASAGVSLDPSIELGSIVRVSDHINLSGTTPLLGLGASRLGPLFPDQTRLHDAALAGLFGGDLSAVAACTLGPALSTPAELSAYRSVGAGVAVQRLSDPLIAAAHAGLSALALTAVTSTLDESPDMQTMVERATRVAPALDEAVLSVARALGPLAAERRTEPGA